MKGRSLGLFLGMALAAALVAVPAADAQSRQGFRLTKLDILDPHIFLDPFGTSACSDITNPPGLLGVNVNGLVQELISACSPANGGCVNDFNLVAIFEPLDQTPGEGGALEECMSEGNPCTFTIGLVDECLRQNGTVLCDGDLANSSVTTFSNAGPGFECLDAIPGTTGPDNVGQYVPPVVATDGPCGVSGEIDLTLTLSDDPLIVVPLKGMKLAAQYDGDPATRLIKGLGRGFLSEAAADTIAIEVTEPLPLTLILGQVLPGANKCIGGLNDGLTCSNITQCPANPAIPAPTCVDGRCVGGANDGFSCTIATQCPATRCQVSCAPAGGPAVGNLQDDRDVGPNGESGWWFYIGFEAEAVDVPEPPTPTPTPTPDVPPTDTPTPTNTPTPTDTPTPTNTPVPPTPTDTPTPTFTPTPEIPACPGDCDGDGVVTIGEVQTAANIFLGRTELATCLAADANRDGIVTIGDVVRAAASYRNGCP